MIHTEEFKVKTMEDGGLEYFSPNEKIWIGVDFDGTLAHFDRWCGLEHCGRPIPEMVARVKQWLAEGKDVRIFTARVNDVLYYMDKEFEKQGKVCPDWDLGSKINFDLRARIAIKRWCYLHIGQELPITNSKDYMMRHIYDDIATQVIKNTGKLVGIDELAEKGAIPNDA